MYDPGANGAVTPKTARLLGLRGSGGRTSNPGSGASQKPRTCGAPNKSVGHLPSRTGGTCLRSPGGGSPSSVAGVRCQPSRGRPQRGVSRPRRRRASTAASAVSSLRRPAGDSCRGCAPGPHSGGRRPAGAPRAHRHPRADRGRDLLPDLGLPPLPSLCRGPWGRRGSPPGRRLREAPRPTDLSRLLGGPDGSHNPAGIHRSHRWQPCRPIRPVLHPARSRGAGLLLHHRLRARADVESGRRVELLCGPAALRACHASSHGPSRAPHLDVGRDNRPRRPRGRLPAVHVRLRPGGRSFALDQQHGSRLLVLVQSGDGACNCFGRTGRER